MQNVEVGNEGDTKLKLISDDAEECRNLEEEPESGSATGSATGCPLGPRPDGSGGCFTFCELNLCPRDASAGCIDEESGLVRDSTKRKVKNSNHLSMFFSNRATVRACQTWAAPVATARRAEVAASGGGATLFAPATGGAAHAAGPATATQPGDSTRLATPPRESAPARITTTSRYKNYKKNPPFFVVTTVATIASCVAAIVSCVAAIASCVDAAIASCVAIVVATIVAASCVASFVVVATATAACVVAADAATVATFVAVVAFFFVATVATVAATEGTCCCCCNCCCSCL